MSEELDAIFRRAKKGVGLFADRDALASDHIPDRLPFRDSQTNEIGRVLSGVLHESKPSNLLLYGKTGTGKTAVVKYVLSRLELNANKDQRNLIIAYVNTRIANTVYGTLAEFAGFLDLPEDERIPFTGLAIAEVMKRIFKHVKTKHFHVILVMDEIDHLVRENDGADILYQFTRSNERLTPGFITLVGISNDLQFKESLDPRVLSSLGEEELVFPPYTVEELRQILTERANVAFKPLTVSPAAINLCAAIAGSEHGDARRAIDLLRIAGEVAERNGLKQVDDSCIRKASEKMEVDRVDEAIRSLPVQNKAILAAVSAFPAGTNTGALYLAYNKLCNRLGIEVLTQRRVSGILGELDLLGLVEASVVSKGRRGRTKKIQLLIEKQALEKCLSEDPAFPTTS